jgi:predicted PurR-regulated permease PerM
VSLPRPPAAFSPGPGRATGAHHLQAFAFLGSAAVVVAGVYWMRAVLVPIAVAILVTFLLSPLVSGLERRGIHRVAAVLVVVLLTLAIVGGLGWVLTRQLGAFADELPRYSTHLRQKITDLRGIGRGGAVEKVQRTVEAMVGEMQKGQGGRATPNPVPVTLTTSPVLSHLPTLLEAVTTTGVVLVLVIFMLLERAELHDRVIRLFGYRQLTVTTRALDEASVRISRYLVMQSSINGSFGLAIGLGLLLIGLPYAVLCGVLAAALRFIPYVGTWMAFILTLALSLAVFPGWTWPAMVVALFVGLELLAYLVFEPWLFSQSAGVSSVALLVAITFWTWAWGPVGLLLATPMTVCLLVLGKYLPPLGFFDLLLRGEPVLDENVRYYQRLLARNRDEAADVVEAYIAAGDRGRVYDEVLLPAIYYAKQSRDRDQLSEEDVDFVVQATREIMAELDADTAPTGAESAASGGGSRQPAVALGFPACDDGDALALAMVRHGLDPTHLELRTPGPLLAAEVVAHVEAERPPVVCIGSVAHGGLSQARHLCKRLRFRFPDLPLIVGRYGFHRELAADRDSLVAAGATAVPTTIEETQQALMAWTLPPRRAADRAGPEASRAGYLAPAPG